MPALKSLKKADNLKWDLLFRGPRNLLPFHRDQQFLTILLGHHVNNMVSDTETPADVDLDLVLIPSFGREPAESCALARRRCGCCGPDSFDVSNSEDFGSRGSTSGATDAPWSVQELDREL